MQIQQSRRLLWVVLGIAGCVRVTLVRAQEPGPNQEAINLLRQASQLVNQIPEQQRMSAAANIAGQLTAAGDFSTALAMAHSLTRPEDRGSALDSIAYSLDSQGRQEEGISVPLDRSTRALLAIKLNESYLSVEHGGPVRLVVPGGECFTSIKSLDHLELRSEPDLNTAETIALARLSSSSDPSRSSG